MTITLSILGGLVLAYVLARGMIAILSESSDKKRRR